MSNILQKMISPSHLIITKIQKVTRHTLTNENIEAWEIE